MTTANADEAEQTVGGWIDAYWDPDLTWAQWWQMLADAGYSHPMFERSHLGNGTVPVATAPCGTIASKLDRRAGDFTKRRGGADGVPSVGPARHGCKRSRSSRPAPPSTVAPTKSNAISSARASSDSPRSLVSRKTRRSKISQGTE